VDIHIAEIFRAKLFAPAGTVKEKAVDFRRDRFGNRLKDGKSPASP
jgi:hypothetical protein